MWGSLEAAGRAAEDGRAEQEGDVLGLKGRRRRRRFGTFFVRVFVNGVSVYGEGDKPSSIPRL